jgi:hypothetical protein
LKRFSLADMKRKPDAESLETMTSLGIFISTNRDELIRRCHDKFIARSGTSLRHASDVEGVSLFLTQLADEVSPGHGTASSISKGATKHGRKLFSQGFTVDQLVHSFGDVCQAVTGLAVDRGATFSSEEFRTLNGCLDNAIAAAVSEYVRQQRTARQDAALDDTLELKNLVYTALTAFEALQAGTVGVSGATGALVHRSLMRLQAISLKGKLR